MPTYEYRCPDGHDFERFYRKISDAAGQVSCPECGKIAERIMSIGGGFAFKGSGFYLTDYGKNAHRSSAPVKADTGSEGGSKESASPASASGASESGSSSSSTPAAGGESKSTPESKPAATPKTESKPASSGGSTPKKDK